MNAHGAFQNTEAKISFRYEIKCGHTYEVLNNFSLTGVNIVLLLSM